MFITPAQALDIKQDQIDQCVKGTVSYKVADNATAKNYAAAPSMCAVK
nr:hypothetical protein [Psychrobacter sp. PraFG1]UNK04854.1 hypothetical protein MN210_11950 [Psychrobacter sp. PraFG1]